MSGVFPVHSSSFLGFSLLAPAPKHHVALNNQDLLAIIFRNIADPALLSREERIQGRKELRQLAIVCKSFKDPALDLVWSCLDSLLPLVKVLPRLKVIDCAYYCHDAIPVQSKFRWYASKVRVLDLQPVVSGTSSAPAISPHLHAHIVKEMSGESLFPNLKKLSIHTSSSPSNDFMSLSLAISPTIPSVAFLGDGLSTALFTDLCFPLAVRQLSSSLKHLTLNNKTRAITPSVLDSVLQIVHLESLDLQLSENNSINPNTLVRLGQSLKRLKSLTLDLHFPSHRYTTQSQAAQDASPDLFPELKAFHAISRSKSQLCDCTPPFLRKKLTQLTMVISEHISDDYFKQLAETLKDISSVKEIELINADGFKSNVSSPLALSPLLSFPLVEFRVKLSSMSWASDSFTSLIASAYPLAFPLHPQRLRTLILPQKANSTCSVNLAALSNAAAKGANLEALSIGLLSTSHDGSWGQRCQFPTIKSLLLHWRIAQPSKSQLRHLSISEQKPLSTFNAEEYNDIAQLLDLMFPRLVSVTPYSKADRTAPYWKDHWWFIEHLRKMYKEIRLLRTPM